MADPKVFQASSIKSPAPMVPSATLERMQDLLKAKDDTSKFVGLAVLKSVLDNGQLSGDPVQTKMLWESIPPKFLDRLLRANDSEKAKKEEAKDMVDLAVAVLHTFAVLLPQEERQENKLLGRTGPLVKALVQSSPETSELILQTLLTFASLPQGSLELLKVNDISPLTEIANQAPLVLDILSFTWTNASMISLEAAMTVKARVEQVIPTLLITFKDTDALTLLRFIGNVLPKLMPESRPPNPKWLKQLIGVLRNLVKQRPTLEGRAAYTQSAASLLQVYPTTCPDLLFKDEFSGNTESKPFSYLFVNLLLIDLRSSFPSLLSKLNSAEYPPTSERLAAAFDVISSFVGFLVRSLDDEDNVSFSMPPDLLLKLRKDLAETMSLTVEYLRDRWDASIAGVSGLHPSARSGTSTTSAGTRLTITWESMTDKVNEDPLVLAAIRALAIWVREDENENLRNESAGLMDMFMELYNFSSREGLDFRYPILTALEPILATEDDGMLRFSEQGGWEVLFQDLQSILESINASHRFDDITALTRGIEIIRTLLAVVDHASTSYPSEDWMTTVTVTSSMKAPPSTPKPHPLLIEFQIAMLQLATALLNKAPAGMQRRYLPSIIASRGLETQLEEIVKGMEDAHLAAEFMSELEDVRDLGFSGMS